MTHKQHYNIYIASCSSDGGIYHYKLMPDGRMEYASFVAMDRPMYMTLANNKMYILLRDPFESSESGLVTYDIDCDGNFMNLSKILSTKGEVACHLCVDKDSVYCVNYISGSVIKMPDLLVKHIGEGENPIRQDKAHTHFVGLTPDKNFLCVTDLGLDTVFLYDKNLKPISSARVPTGHGARHLVFSDDSNYMFVANELKSTVSSFTYKGGFLKLIDTKSCLPTDFTGESTASAIRFLDNCVYVSNRGHNSISVFEHKNGILDLKGVYPCHGEFPRDFDIIGDFVVTTNEKGNSISVLNRENMRLVYQQKNIKSPVCVAWSL